MPRPPERSGFPFGDWDTGAAWLSSARVVRCWVKSSWPLQGGLHTCYNGDYRGLQPCEGELIPKSRLSSDRTLQLECVKSESLVIADQHAAVNTFPGLVHTARHITKAGCTRSRPT